MKHYRGRRDVDGCKVVIENGDEKADLPMRLDLWNHSPTGFEWGYSGSGPAQLALALLADASGDDTLASRMHQRFKADFVAKLPRNAAWTLTDGQVRRWIEIESMQRQS